MLRLVQRVDEARVTINGSIVGQIERGILLLLGVQAQDNEQTVKRMVEKVRTYRIFPDENGHMNLGLDAIGGDLLVVSQFTLAADTKKGRRPSFGTAAPPEIAEPLYNRFVELARIDIERVETGEFGADMRVSLTNNGPVTFMLEV